MQSYSATWFDPPAPVALVSVRHPTSGQIASEIPMLIDTGADVSLLPRAAAEKIGLVIDAQSGYELSGFDGNKSLAPSAEAHMLFLSRTFRGRYLLIQQEWGIIGRDILNHVSLLLDGVHLSWQDANAPK
jgi:hypothetical protein